MPNLKVTFYKIEIGENGDGAGATWKFNMYVNGESKLWAPANVSDNTSYNISYPFEKYVNDDGILSVDTGGYEDDGDFADNAKINGIGPIDYKKSENWGVGSQKKDGNGDDGITYTISYLIEKLPPTVKLYQNPKDLVAEFISGAKTRANNKSDYANTVSDDDSDIAAKKDSKDVLAKLNDLENSELKTQIEFVLGKKMQKGWKVVSFHSLDSILVLSRG